MSGPNRPKREPPSATRAGWPGEPAGPFPSANPVARSAQGGPVRRMHHIASAWRMVAGLCLTLSLALPVGLARAGTPGVDEPPLPQAPLPVELPALHESTLPNGLTVIVAPRPGLPLVSWVLAVRTGPEADPAGRSGVAALTATLLTKGARRDGRDVPAPVLARQAEALGGQLDSASGWQLTSLSMTVTTPRAPAALALLSDAFRQPLLSSGELTRTRAQAVDGLKLALGSPGEVAAMALRHQFWGHTPHGAVVTPASLGRVGAADVRAFHRRWMRPDNAVLVAVGDVDPAEVGALAARHLGGWRAASTPLPTLAAQPPQPQPEPLLLVDMPGAGQSAVMVAAPFVAASRGERLPLRIGQLANAVLGGGYSSRLNQEVRIRRGLSYGAGSQAESQPAGGMLSAQAQTRHASAAEVLQLMRREFARLGEAAPSPDELSARQANLAGSFARRLQSTASLAGLVLGQWAQRRPLADLEHYAADLQSVQANQVQAFAGTHWPAPALRAVVVGDLGAAGSNWATDGVRKVTLEQLMPMLAGAPMVGRPALPSAPLKRR